MKKYLYIAACAADGGVYRYEMKNGAPIFIDKYPCPSPMYLAKEGDTMYVLLRAPFADNENSGVMTCRIASDGALTEPTAPVSTGGRVGCHLAVREGDVYVANYVSGSVCHLGHTLVTHEGRGPHPTRQTSPHAHGVFFTPDFKHVLAADLGTDTVYTYDRALREVSRAEVAVGEGCRHMVFSKDGGRLYVVNELGNSITLFDVANGRLSRGESYQTLSLPRKENITHKASAIRLSADGRHLYVTNRGENTVAHFAVRDTGLTHIASYPTLGDEPRDFLIFDGGRTAAVTNQFSDSVLFYAVGEDGALTPTHTLSLPAPLCLLET